jgi:2'-phosphotransferase
MRKICRGAVVFHYSDTKKFVGLVTDKTSGKKQIFTRICESDEHFSSILTRHLNLTPLNVSTCEGISVVEKGHLRHEISYSFFNVNIIPTKSSFEWFDYDIVQLEETKIDYFVKKIIREATGFYSMMKCISVDKIFPNIRQRLVSRTLSKILRHKLVELDLDVSDDGYVKISDLLDLSLLIKFCPTEEYIIKIANEDKKTRFSIIDDEKGHLLIRANQGHSKKVGKLLVSEKLLTKIEMPLPICIHGTNIRALDKIKVEGLKIMGRTHIHCASDTPDKVKSGYRPDCGVLIFINMEMAIASGIQFFISDNGVILTPGNEDGILSPDFFDEIRII